MATDTQRVPPPSPGPYTVGDKPAWSSKRTMTPIRDADGKVVCYIMGRGAATDANAALLARSWAMFQTLQALYDLGTLTPSQEHLIAVTLKDLPSA